jgi:hypothetical protein
MSLRHVAAVTILALVGTTLMAGPAQAHRAARDGHDHFPVSVDTTLPPNSDALLTTPSLGDADQLTIKMKPKTHDDVALDAIHGFLTTIGTLSKSKRLLVCVMLHEFVLQGGGEEIEGSFTILHQDLALAYLGACLQIARLIPGDPGPARAASPACNRTNTSIPARVRKTSAGFKVTVNGTTTKPKKPPLKVSCRVKGNQVTYKVRTAKKGVPLRKVVGKRLAFGIQSPSDSEATVPLKVTFNTP